MNLIHVIPILRGISKETLTYFTPTKVEPGSLVKIPVRSKSTFGIVVRTENAIEEKASLKASPFAIRKLGEVSGTNFLPAAFMRAAEKAAGYFAGSTGSVITSLIPKAVIESLANLQLKQVAAQEEDSDEKPKGDTVVVQAPEEERIAHYKSLIREAFARKGSVLFCLPSIQDIKKVSESISKGIEEYTFILHSQLSKKEIAHLWQMIAETSHPVLVLGTGSILALPRDDIATIIVDRENSSVYKALTRPYVDIRTFAELYTRELGARLILGSELLRVETLWRRESGEITELMPLKFRTTTTAKTTLVDTRTEKSPLSSEFTILSSQAETLIRENKENNEFLFLFGARRGLAPTTVCGDCGNVVACGNCSAPTVLHKGPKGSFFLCHKCGERRSAEERCKVCGSWRLVTLGIGVELIEEVLKKHFPDLNVFRIDKDSVTTLKRGQKVVEDFYNSPGSVLLGTEMALLYLDKPLDNAIIVSLDSLFSVPDFRINEKIASLIVRIRTLATKNFLLQTRLKDQQIVDSTIQGNMADVYREEIEERKRFEYPPFWTLIKISLKGERTKVREKMSGLEDFFKPFSITVFPAFTEVVKGSYVMHGLIRIPKKDWPHGELLSKLMSLGPEYSINVDPESLL